MRDYAGIALTYAQDVTSGKVLACKWVKLACQRHLDDLARADWPYRFDAWDAGNPCDFIEKLPHVEGRWSSPTITLEPWQIWLLCAVFGWRRKSDGGRRFEQAYVECARKNAKSALTSGISLFCLTCEDEVGPQVKTAATTGGQARIVFEVASKMARATPDLCETFALDLMANSIVCKHNNGSIQPINAKSSTQDGLNPHLTVIDELHAHKDRSLFDVLRSATGARKNPLGWYITTAGYSTTGVCYEQRSYLTKILEGVIDDDAYFGVIYTLDDGDDPFDEAAWLKANPNLGVSVALDKMRSYARQAQNSPASAGEFLTKRLNKWQNAASAWLPIEAWKACADSKLSMDGFVRDRAWIGVDLADTNDVAALVIIFERGGIFTAFAKFFLPEDLVDVCAHRTTTHYKVWSDEGWITTTPGDFIDHGAIEQEIRALCGRFQVQGVRIEHYGSAQIAASLMSDALPVEIVHKKPDTYSDAAKLLEALIDAHRFQFDGNPMLTWMASNCVVDRRVNGSILPKKEHKDSPKKIDGMDALILALGGSLAAEDNRSIYDIPELWDDAPATGGNPPVERRAGDDGLTWSPAILQDMANPLFAEHKRRFEAWQDMQDD